MAALLWLVDGLLWIIQVLVWAVGKLFGHSARTVGAEPRGKPSSPAWGTSPKAS